MVNKAVCDRMLLELRNLEAEVHNRCCRISEVIKENTREPKFKIGDIVVSNGADPIGPRPGTPGIVVGYDLRGNPARVCNGVRFPGYGRGHNGEGYIKDYSCPPGATHDHKLMWDEEIVLATFNDYEFKLYQPVRVMKQYENGGVVGMPGIVSGFKPSVKAHEGDAVLVRFPGWKDGHAGCSAQYLCPTGAEREHWWFARECLAPDMFLCKQ